MSKRVDSGMHEPGDISADKLVEKVRHAIEGVGMVFRER